MDITYLKLIAVFVCGALLSTDLSAGEVCKSCNVFGVLFPPEKPFDFRRECLEMTGCYCYCGSGGNSWFKCKKERNFCDRTVESARDFHTSRRSSSYYSSQDTTSTGSGGGAVIQDVKSEGCNRQCDVAGKLVDGGTYFNHKEGCLSYSSCYCGCDGKWQCPASNAENTCTGAGGGQLVDVDESGCRPCVIDGTRYRPESPFTYRNNCIEWSDCRCRCDGSWRCASSSGKWVCDNVCRECEVGNRKIPGRSTFRHQTECVVYEPCTCNCDGSWDCPAKNGKWICTNKCLNCTVNGNEYPGRSKFKVREDCWEWEECDCNCDGSWQCPRESAKWICTDQCLECDVKGQKYQGNTLFQYTEGCYEYNCNCRCDGGWSCPANRTRDICRLNMQTGCYNCVVNGQNFEGNKLFTYEEKCIRYEYCTCNCDGSWECPGERAKNICSRNETTGCDSCDVYGQTTPGRSRFELQQDCWSFNCECGCNGNWRCSETGAQYICGGQLLDTSGCKSCLAEGQRFASQSSFEIVWGCVAFQCSCNCDGSWSCPSRNAKTTCSDSHFQKFLISAVTNLPSSWCTECTIGGSVYPGYSQFEYQEKCTRQYARCYCNGGYRFDSSIITGCSGITEISVSNGNCIECKFNDKTYSALSEFEVSSQCKRYRCKCECNGRPACQAVTENVCGSVLTFVKSNYVQEGGSQSVSVQTGGGTRETVVVGGGGGTRTETVVVSGGTSGGTGTIVTGGGGSTSTSRTLVVNAGGTGTSTGTTGTVVTGGGGSRTVVVSGGTGGGQTGTRVVAIGGGGSERTTTTTKETRVVVTGGGDSTRTVVSGSGGSGRTVVSVGGSDTTGTTAVIGTDGSICYHCVGLDGKRYPGNSEFRFRRGCAVWKCQCNCYGRAICRPDDLSACLVEPQCRSCVVDGKTYKSNRMFSYEKDCVLHQCRCMCDGRPRCVQTVALDCKQEENTCKQCVVGGQRYQPNTMFDIETRCRRQRCQCDCSGDYRCTSPQNLCSTTEPQETCEACELDGKSFQAGTTFTVDRGCYRMTCSCSCSDRLTCDQSKTVDICENDQGERCKACLVDGERYAPNTKFEREVGCDQRRCQCRCDGTFSCISTGVKICDDEEEIVPETTPAPTQAPVTRPQNCQKCVADRIERQIDVPFCLDRGCKRYTCTCNCNGRFSCQTDKPENICDENGNKIGGTCNTAAVTTSTGSTQTGTSSTGSRTSTTGTSTGTRTSSTSTGTRTTSTSTSTGTRTSSTNVVTDSTKVGAYYTEYEERRGGVVVSEADRRGRCMQCNVQEQYYAGNSEFEFDIGCKKFRCRCSCDGTWECPRQRPANTCQKETCKTCRLRGQEYQPNTRFTIDIDRCRKYQCTCPCSGRYSCPVSDIINTCEEQCQQCEVKGNVYQPNTQFSYDENCLRYSCDCNCEGKWNCPAERTVRICNTDQLELVESQCRECEVKGQRYRGNSRFSYDENCFRYSCDCRCDGSWNCPADRTERICNTQPQPGQCRECEVKGRRYRGNSRFSYDEDCFRFNCDCNCDGSWNCPADRTEKICETQPQPGQCRDCEVKGRRYRGNSRFSYDEDCFRYNCDCNCDGSWNCPASRTERICESGSNLRTETSRTVITEEQRAGTTNVGQCRECDVEGQRYRGNSKFSYDKDCFRFNCDCNCDGSWNCPADRTEKICDTQPQPGQCRECEVKGRRYRGNSRFSYDEDCFRYNCDCNCDGSWNCPASRTERICESGSNLRTETSRTVITEEQRAGTTNVGQCRECEVKGQRYRGNSKFSYDEDCFRFNCDCNCDGSWNCPADRTEKICDTQPQPGQCRECEVKGRRYRGNSRFSYDENCFRYNCDCNCDGSWNCPASRTERICESGNNLRTEIETSRTVVTDSQRTGSTNVGQCRECEVKGRRYRGNSRFSYDEDCFRYNCDCNCDGSWNCPASRTERICGPGNNLRTETSRTVITDSQRTGSTNTGGTGVTGSSQTGSGSSSRTSVGSGTSSLETQRTGSGSNRETRTETHTSTSTHTTSSKTVLGGSQSITEIRSRSGQTSGSAADTRGCRYCIVNGVQHRGNSRFQFDNNCFRFNCECRCDGSWTCPGDRTENICPNQCRQCQVKGQSYPPNTIFEYDEGCSRFSCDCACDGSFNCPAARTKDICGGRGTKCTTCVVKGRPYNVGPFSYKDGCFGYNCECNCDGSWKCPSSETENLCAGLRADTCQECRVNGKTYQARAPFSYIDGCSLKKCTCACDGSFDCTSTDICQSSGRVCRDCVVKEKRYVPNNRFQYTEGCNRFDCDCNCNGSWDCPAQRTQDLCALGQCQKCMVRGKEKPGNSGFVVEENCRQYKCWCHCDGQWTCSKDFQRVCNLG